MATEASQPLKISLPASAALATAVVNFDAGTGVDPQYTFVTRDSAGRVIVCASATAVPIGVLQNKPIHQDDACEIVVVGVTKVQVTSAGTPFTTFNDGVAPYTDGTAQKATATGFGAAYVQGSKSMVGKIAQVGGLGVGLPAAGDVARFVIDCVSAPAPAT